MVGGWGVERRVDLDVRLAPACSSRYLCDGGLVLVLQPGLLLVRTHLNIFFKHTATFHFTARYIVQRILMFSVRDVLKRKLLKNFHSVQNTVSRLESKQCLFQVCGSKRLNCHAGHQEVGRCHTRVETEESIPYKEGIDPDFEPRADITRSPK